MKEKLKTINLFPVKNIHEIFAVRRAYKKEFRMFIIPAINGCLPVTLICLN